MGGLGNQLFQIFTVIGCALDNNIPFQFLYSKTVGSRTTYWDTFFAPIKGCVTTIPFGGTIKREKGFHYEPININNSKNQNNETTILSGYFQSPKYFERHKTKIAEMVMHLTEYKTKITKNRFIDREKTISMHFRLGDYVLLPDYHPVLPLDYYVKSIQEICKIANSETWTIYYFCEEADFKQVFEEYISKLHLNFDKCEFVRVEPRIPDYLQMLTMSCCKNHIIANSTFSWWGAYLNFSQDKIVCYPSTWFGKKLAHNSIKDLIPENENWIQITPL
jgi:hypothetical protein